MIGKLSVFTSESKLAKTYRLDVGGELVKTTAAQMTAGSYAVCEFASVSEFAALIEGLNTHQAICASLPKDGSVSGRVVCQAALNANPGAVARTKQFFSLQGVPGLLFVDSDAGQGEALSRDDLWSLLLQAAPALADGGVLWRPSGSSHICRGEQDLTGLRGQHVLALLADASDGPRVVKALAARLWLLGHGQIQLSKSGAMLVRCPVDTAPADAARLIFAAGADAVAPLEQRRGPAVILSGGTFIDSRRLIPDLNADEQARYEMLLEQAKSARYAEAMAIRADAKSKEISRRLPLLMKEGATASEAEQRLTACLDAAYGGVLLGDFELTVVHPDGRHEVVTVAEVLRSRERWNGADTLSPLNNEHRNFSADARLFLQGASPILYSLDGLEVFRLRQQATRLQTTKGARGELVEGVCRVLAEQDDVFMTDAGPVQMVDGRLIPLTAPRVQNLIGSRVALFTREANGKESPADLPREVADLALTALM